ncbi:2-phosphosulfolactate phosphatase [Pseudoxanthomonas gei]|uniref:Probable 2-phosphosulfolactate phosphatase n=1 Tax=Pseudoxanthomonas gei TaxID=1383030 RepID=A0ABX0A9D6_9GAMM|nr:2-phosphosulfolactate phosphatase [Pseudoxanthomonas gei]NDK38143.1 2-phosphosulfolactate phosphatase [Pseudoxanthomonas gei]
MPKLHVLLKKEEVDSARLEGKVVIVLDVLFGTSTIVHAFAQGIVSLWPARDAAEAHRIAANLDQPMLAGEFLAATLPGFAPPTPLALAACGLRGATVVYATTNGTAALANSSNAAFVYVGALLNGAALVARVTLLHPDAQVLIVCSGSMERFNLEDFYGAGHLVAHFERRGNYEFTDAAQAALLLYHGCAARTALGASRVGQMMLAQGLQHEVDCAARLDVLEVVPELRDGCVRLAA